MSAQLVLRSSLVLIAITVFPAAQEPFQPKLTPSIITATKQVTLFTELERQLLQAVQKKEQARLEEMLEDDFEIAMPDADPLAGEDWVDAVMDKDFSLKSFFIRQMSVAEQGACAVVKYQRVQQASWKGTNSSGEFFVVDLWKKNGDTWKLADRYVAKLRALPPEHKIQAKPTGKE
jgi:ketosteroid isomerase-like protein